MTVEIYTRATCAPCKMMKAYMTNKGIDYVEKDVDADPSLMDKVIELSGRMMVPVTVVGEKVISVFNIVKSYDTLFKKAVEENGGNLQPYLQQLSGFDPRDIEEHRMQLELSEDIGVRALKAGMLSSKTETQIKTDIKRFLSPTVTKTHGRPIYRDDAADCGLVIEKVDVDSKVWQLSRELYTRTNYVVSTRATKCIETKDISFTA